MCMLFEVVTIDLHYMTDRQQRQRFDRKISKLKKYCGNKDLEVS